MTGDTIDADVTDGYAGLSFTDVSQRFATVGELYEAARLKLDAAVWDFLEGGAGDEDTLVDNRRAFASWKFRPAVMSGIEGVDTSTEFLGIDLSMPALTSPFGADRLFDPEGHQAVARANSRFGIASIVPEASSFSLEEIAKAGPAAAKIFQLHPLGAEGNFERIVGRAEDAGYRALCVTVDCPTGGWRERNMRNRFSPDFAIITGNYGHQNAMEIFGPMRDKHTPIWGWPKLTKALSRTELPWMAKGILTAHDGRAAVEAGASAVLVSNHGGRQLDGAPASLDQLEEITDAVGADAQIALDSGIRRGSDIVKALALGADVVVMGRAPAMALTADGEEGVYRLLELLHDEMTTIMTLLGRPTIASLERTVVQPARRDP